MSAFYGMVQGNRGEATRGGSKSSGFKASCQSYDGSVITRMRYDRDDKLLVTIDLASGSTSCYGADEYFRGTMEELAEALGTYMKKKRGEA